MFVINRINDHRVIVSHLYLFQYGPEALSLENSIINQMSILTNSSLKSFVWQPPIAIPRTRSERFRTEPLAHTVYDFLYIGNRISAFIIRDSLRICQKILRPLLSLSIFEDKFAKFAKLLILKEKYLNIVLIFKSR
jgi:hypothetical protein